ncbi:TonB-dependent receptor plug domain-containing protein [Reichenbachiella versicolor]|uniref:TonB-dependent receptor plug domain-containing protein n=1 Tax=Reichenbachiella versicolor TaxID=1821036 RepID=UPI0013A55F85|nr:TonB-dependent receptor [Reichenbachiella versicolor]
MSQLNVVLIIVFFILNFSVSAQKLVVEVQDSEAGFVLQGTLVKVNNQTGVTDTNGKVSFNIPSGKTNILITRIGYQQITDTIEVSSDEQKLLYKLQIEDILIGEIEINDDRLVGQNSDIGVQYISSQDMAYAPSIGEADVLNAIKTNAGVYSGGENVGGYYVRGGAADQNLIVLDGATIYNPNHLFGFFSVFNSDILDEVAFYKGGFRPSMGGRVSSIMNIRTLDPSLDKIKGNIGIGTISASASLEVPIIKEKLGVHLATRRMYVDKLSALVLPEDSEVRNSLNSYFFDLNGKLVYRLGANDKITFTSFYGQDGYINNGINRNNGFTNNIGWENQAYAMNYYHLYNDMVSQDFTISRSQYDVNFNATILNYVLGIYSSIDEVGFSSRLYIDDLLPNQNTELSFEIKQYQFVPNTFDIRSGDFELNTLDEEKLNAREVATSLNQEMSIGDRVSLNIGGRFSWYYHLGEHVRYSADPSLTVVDSVFYAKGEKIVNFQNLEPRVSIRYKLGDDSNVQLAYDKMSQYVHLAPVSSVSLPTDVWVPSTEKIKPQIGHQLSSEYSIEFPDEDFSLGLSAYYKTVNNVIEYQNGILLGYGTSGLNFDDNFLSGRLESKGAEIVLRKRLGKWSSKFDYTLSKTDQVFEELNEGVSFPAKYDSRHVLNAQIVFEINDRVSINSAFSYSTGNAITVPIGRYIIDGNVIGDYEGRNNLRLPAYHRLDLGMRLQGKKGGVWNFGIYNVYNRRNPYYVYYDLIGSLEELEVSVDIIEVSLFTIIPSVQYEYRF